MTGIFQVIDSSLYVHVVSSSRLVLGVKSSRRSALRGSGYIWMGRHLRFWFILLPFLILLRCTQVLLLYATLHVLPGDIWPTTFRSMPASTASTWLRGLQKRFVQEQRNSTRGRNFSGSIIPVSCGKSTRKKARQAG